ncbi:MAG: hypothetical protein JXA73_05250 [Acidobacteria bacterium]|nr:hypothetical protein [Acidobacteriota bacterium]
MNNTRVQPKVKSQENLLAAYEDLRCRMAGCTDGWREAFGLALFLRQGMAAWMEALCQPAAFVSERFHEKGRSDPAMPLDLRAEAARILTAMAVSSFQEMRK